MLFIDEAHYIHDHTLNGPKPRMEFITAGGGKLSVVLVGHLRLQNDLRRATMEEIGNRMSKFDFVAVGGQRREFLQWLLETCIEDGVGPDSVIKPQAQDFLVGRLSPPLQFAEHLNRAFTDASDLGAGKVSRENVENTPRPASTVSTSSSCGPAIRPRPWSNGSMRIRRRSGAF